MFRLSAVCNEQIKQNVQKRVFY